MKKHWMLRAALASLCLTTAAASAQAQVAMTPAKKVFRPIPRPIPIPIPIPIPLPQDNCPNQAEDIKGRIGTSFGESLLSVPFSVRPSLGAQAIADCEKIGMSVDATVDVGLFDGLISGSAIKLVAEATAADDGANTLDVTLEAFGKDLWNLPITRNTGRLRGSKRVSLALPDFVTTSGSFEGSKTVLGEEVGYSIGWDVVSTGGGLVRWDLSNTRAFASVWASANTDANIHASLTALRQTLRKSGAAYLYWFGVGAHASVGLDGDQWRASTAGSLAARGLEGRLKISLPSFLPDFTIFDWAGFNTIDSPGDFDFDESKTFNRN